MQTATSPEFRHFACCGASGARARLQTGLRWLGLLTLLLVAAACGGGDGGATPDGDAADAVADGGREIFVPGDASGVDGTPGDATADSVGDAAGALDGDAGPAPPSGFPAEGLLVRVVAPSAGGSAAVSSAVVPVRGVLFGRTDRLRWESDSGDSGSIEPAPFWTLPGLSLAAGDNVVTVIAEGPDGSATDTVVITYNPSFPFAGPPTLTPPVLFAGEPTEVRFSVPLDRATNFLPDTVALHRVDDQLQSVARVADLVDDGAVATSGDEVHGDGRFSGRATLVCDPESPLVVRVALQATTTTSQYRALSALLPVPCVERVAPSRCETVRGRLRDARGVWESALAGAETPDYGAATTAAAAWLANQAGVATSGESPAAGVWLVESGGLLGAADLGARALRGGGAPASPDAPRGASASTSDTEQRRGALSGIANVGSRRALLFDPWGVDGRAPDEIAAAATALEAEGCPGFPVDGPFRAAAATLTHLRSLGGHGVVALAADGGTFFGDLDPSHRAALDWHDAGAQPVVWTGEAVDCDALLAGPQPCAADADCPGDLRCLRTRPNQGACFDALQADLALGRLVVGPDTWGVLPAFFDAHAGALPDAIVYVGACRTLEVGGLAAALYAAGARAVFAWSGPVSTEVATRHGAALLEALVGAGRATGDALPPDAVDPEAGGRLTLFGADDLRAAPEGLLDPNFEAGDLRGWETTGDVRLMQRLGATGPVDGQRFAVVSTGLGLDRRNGALRQTFCVPAGRSELTFWWKAISEEIPLNCGSVNQDRFRAVLRGAFTTVTAVDVTVDDLCLPSACPACGHDYGPLAVSDIGLDQGAPSATAWRAARFDVQPFLGGEPVVLELTVSDQGDSAFDTAVLVDDFRLH